MAIDGIGMEEIRIVDGGEINRRIFRPLHPGEGVLQAVIEYDPAEGVAFGDPA